MMGAFVVLLALQLSGALPVGWGWVLLPLGLQLVIWLVDLIRWEMEGN